MGLLAVVTSAVSGIVGAAAWVVHHVRSLNVAAQSWTCVECEVANELDRDTCWSCGAGYGQDPLYPSHIPMERRWLCMSCAVWNGIARTGCWRCGAIRNVEGESGSRGSQGPPAGTRALDAPTASGRRVAQRSVTRPASRRRNS